MKIVICGMGYVGLVQAVCLADMGHEVVGVETDQDKLDKLNAGVCPIYEPELEELMRKNSSRLRFQSDLEIGEAEAVFIAVGTPASEVWSVDTSYVQLAASQIGIAIDREKPKHHVTVINKSTVPIGFTRKIAEIIKKATKRSVSVLNNPEFLREGTAVQDFMKPSRIVVGFADYGSISKPIIEEIYSKVPFSTKMMVVSYETAELIKYASNAYLATQISFINSLARLADTVGADIDDVSEGMKLDERIGSKAFLKAGMGYGGSCFPKDVQGLLNQAEERKVPLPIVASAYLINSGQPDYVIYRLRSFVPHLQGKKIVVLGVTFKPNTDDTRESPAVVLANKLADLGATVVTHDPMYPAEDEANLYKDADVLIVATDWPEFRDLKLKKVAKQMAFPLMLDARNMFDREIVEAAGFTYIGVGR